MLSARQSGDIEALHPAPESGAVDAKLVGNQGAVAIVLFNDADKRLLVGATAGAGGCIDGLTGHV